MATSLGIHLQSHGFDYVLLDGSAKRYSVKKSGGAVFRPEDLQSSKRLGKLINDTVKAGKVDQVVVTLPASGVVMRELSLPFSDREKVMQVLKFEIESELYHLSFEDVIADFIELNDGRATPTLLVSVLEKERVSSTLDTMGGADWDPPVVTLSHGSLYTALQALPREASDEDALETYLQIGSESSLLLVLNADGSLRATRALPMGWRELTRGLNVVDADAEVVGSLEEPAAEEGDSEEDAEAALATSESGGDEEEADAEADENLALGGDASLPFGISFEGALQMASDSQVQEFLARLASEVRRGLIAMGSSSGPIYLMGAEIPGLEAHLEARLGREVAPLSLGIEAGDGSEPDPVALGAAMRGVGVDTASMNFRQEEFRYARGLERVEGPLTLALVGLIVFFAFDMAINFKVTQQIRRDADAIYEKANSKVARLNDQVREDEEYPDAWIIKNDFAGTNIEDSQRINLLGRRVNEAKIQLDALMGEADLEMPHSCLEAWRLLMNFLEEELADYDGKWMVESFEFTSMNASSREQAHVKAQFGITLFPDGSGGFIGRFDRLLANLSKKGFVLGTPELPSTENAEVGGAKTGTVTVKMIAGKANKEVE